MLLMHFEQLVIWTLVSQGDTQGMIFMVLYMVFSHLFLFLEYKPNPKKIHSMNCIGDNYLVESLLSSHPKLVLSSNSFFYICHSYSVPLLLFSWNCSYMIRDSEIHPLFLKKFCFKITSDSGFGMWRGTEAVQNVYSKKNLHLKELQLPSISQMRVLKPLFFWAIKYMRISKFQLISKNFNTASAGIWTEVKKTKFMPKPACQCCGQTRQLSGKVVLTIRSHKHGSQTHRHSTQYTDTNESNV